MIDNSVWKVDSAKNKRNSRRWDRYTTLLFSIFSPEVERKNQNFRIYDKISVCWLKKINEKALNVDWLKNE